MLNPIQISIAGITLGATGNQEGVRLDVTPAYEKFKVTGVTPDISLTCRYGSVPPRPYGQLVMDSGGSWCLFQQNQHYTFAVGPEPGPDPQRLAIVDRLFSRAEVYHQHCDEETNFCAGNTQGPVTIYPFAYPLDELLMLNYLAQGRGVIIHSCGVADQGRGWLFPGVSGAGKSTIAERWKHTDVALMSDDRVIIRRVDGNFRMFGTPWHGDARIGSPESAPLERLFFLQQAPQNYLKALTPADAAARLLVRCFPPFYNREGMQYILDLLAQIAEETPSYELGFVPDDRVTDFVRNLQ